VVNHHGTRTRFSRRQGFLDRKVVFGGPGNEEKHDHDGPSNEEDEEEFGWLLGEGIAPNEAARAWGTVMLLRDCKVYGDAWHNVTRPGVLKEGGNRYYAPSLHE